MKKKTVESCAKAKCILKTIPSKNLPKVKKLKALLQSERKRLGKQNNICLK